MKKMLKPLIISEMQVKTPVRSYRSSVRMFITKKTKKKKKKKENAAKDTEKVSTPISVGENVE
jgi:hypothetical protein